MYFNQTIQTIKLFKGLYNDVFLAGDFDGNGNFIDESINIEVMPKQSKDVYYKIRKILTEKFDIDNFDTCDNLFDNYYIDKFHFHVKIKYSNTGLVVKFYNTHPINPFLKYYDK